MSTLPLNWAPSAMVTRAAFTLPMTRAPCCRSTRSARGHVAREGAGDDERAAGDVGLDGRAVLDGDAFLGGELAAHVPATTTSSSVVISPSIVIPAPMTVLAMGVSVLSRVCQRRAVGRPRVSARDEPPSSGGRSNSQSSRPEKRAPSSMATALPRRLPRTRAPETRRTGPDGRHVTLERAADGDRLGLDGLAGDASPPSAMVRSPRMARSPSTWPSMSRSPSPWIRPRTRAPLPMRAACPSLRVVVRAWAMIGARS